MPFLRSLEVVDSSLELRSSKTLIGSAAATCDVVVTGDNVLELHALLNLAADKASAKLVPFSTTEAGVCYVNDVVVPREGAVVVHGDRVAFGHPRNVFLFELTPHPQMTAVSSAHSIETENSTQHSTASANRAFRKALDTLRGDRKTTTPTASVMASIQSNQPAARNRSIISSAGTSAPSVSKSKDPLSKFLLEASTDSLLSDYVERKLKQRQNGSKTRSSPASVASSSSVRQSREERNLAEVEKLRLSQRIREVNDVLNGDMEFRESCLSPSAKSVSKPHWRDGNNRKSIRTSIDENGDDDEEEDEDDDLPSMMEKHTSPLADRRPVSVSASIQTEHSEQDIISPRPGHVKAEEVEIDLPDNSLESLPVSEASHSQPQLRSQRQPYNPPKARDFFAKAMSLGLNDLTRSHPRPIKMERQDVPLAKTAMHEKLITQTIRLKRNEIMSRAFVRWQRGLRTQSQNREGKARQLQEASAALGKLRCGQVFNHWRDVAATSSQVIICRLEAYQQRCESRLVRKCWMALYLHHLSTTEKSKLLYRLIVQKATIVRRIAFRRWERLALNYTRDHLIELQRRKQHRLDIHLESMSKRHYRHRILQPLLVQIIRRWRAKADRHKKQRHMLRKVFLRGVSKLVLYAWRKWTEVTHFEHYHVKLRTQTEQHVQQTTERLTSQHDQVQSSMRESHAQQLQKLMELIEEKDQELEKIKRQQRAEILDKAAAKMRWEKDLHSFFESAVVKCDEQIAEASDQLEGLLQRAEDDVLAARFGAAQFLVHCILQQKIFNANEYIRLHEAQLSKLPRGPSPPSLDPTDDLVSKLSSNGRFLYDMIQQRLTRLQQLHQSLAKLAAVSDVCSGSLDPERLRHSSFLADALLQRQQSHLLLVIARFRP